MLLKIANHTDDTTVLGSKHFWSFLSTRVYNLCIVPYIHKCYILARDAFVGKNRCAIDKVRLSVCLFVCVGRAYIVIIRCTLVQI